MLYTRFGIVVCAFILTANLSAFAAEESDPDCRAFQRVKKLLAQEIVAEKRPMSAGTTVIATAATTSGAAAVAKAHAESRVALDLARKAAIERVLHGLQTHRNASYYSKLAQYADDLFPKLIAERSDDLALATSRYLASLSAARVVSFCARGAVVMNWLTGLLIPDVLHEDLDELRKNPVLLLAASDEIACNYIKYYPEIRKGIQELAATVEGCEETLSADPNGDASIVSGHVKRVDGVEAGLNPPRKPGETTSAVPAARVH